MTYIKVFSLLLLAFPILHGKLQLKARVQLSLSHSVFSSELVSLQSNPYLFSQPHILSKGVLCKTQQDIYQRSTASQRLTMILLLPATSALVHEKFCLPKQLSVQVQKPLLFTERENEPCKNLNKHHIHIIKSANNFLCTVLQTTQSTTLFRISFAAW